MKKTLFVLFAFVIFVSGCIQNNDMYSHYNSVIDAALIPEQYDNFLISFDEFSNQYIIKNVYVQCVGDDISTVLLFNKTINNKSVPVYFGNPAYTRLCIPAEVGGVECGVVFNSEDEHQLRVSLDDNNKVINVNFC